MNRLFSPRTLLFMLLLAMFVPRAGAQAVLSLNDIKSQAELDKAIAALDGALFDSYNRCDLEKFSSFFADDVEFYHDQGGATLGRAALTDSIKKNICGKVTRELVPGTLQVHYMKGYGAVEMGRPPLPPSGARRHRRCRRSQLHSPLAIQRWRLEDHPRHQLRPSLCENK